MAKFHIDVNGTPAVCNAKSRGCPRGGEDEHGATREEVAQKFEAKQAELTMPKAVKKVSKAALTKSVLKKLATADDALQAEVEYRKRVMASVQPELDAIAARVAVNRAERTAAMAEIFEASDLDDFTDKKTATTLYELGWDNGSGSSDFMELQRKVLTKSQLSMGGWQMADGAIPVATLAIHVDEDADEERVTRSAELLSKIYPTQQEIQPTVSITVYNRSLEDTHLSRDLESGEWAVRSGTSEYNDFSSANVRDVLEYLNKEDAAFFEADNWLSRF